MEEQNVDTVETVESVESQEVAEPVAEQTEQTELEQQTGKTERDSYFADMRRKQELDELRNKTKGYEEQLNSAHNLLKNYFDGETLQEQLDFAQAQAEGRDVRDIKSDRENRSRVAELENTVKQYREQEVHRQMENDLKDIQAINPEITSLDDLPPSFIALRFNEIAPMSAKEAYIAVQAIEKQTKQLKPISTGSVTSTTSPEREYFTREELDRLTSKELDDPKIFRKAMESMARLK